MATPDKYAVLVRGINVGGRRPVPKKAFKEALEDLGFSNVTIYLNSGNAVLSSTAAPRASEIQSALKARFGFDIPTLVLSAQQMMSIAAAVPLDWVYNKPSPEKQGWYSHVAYLFHEVDSPDFAEKIGYRPELETCIYVPGALLHTVPHEHWSKSCLSKLASKRDYANVTIRNVNTARALADLMQGTA